MNTTTGCRSAACKGHWNQEAINCLQPDRRVEIHMCGPSKAPDPVREARLQSVWLQSGLPESFRKALPFRPLIRAFGFRKAQKCG